MQCNAVYKSKKSGRNKEEIIAQLQDGEIVELPVKEKACLLLAKMPCGINVFRVDDGNEWEDISS